MAMRPTSPAKPGFTRRDLLRVAGGLGVAGLLAGCGSNTGRSSGPTISQWYHQYGEAGTQQAAQRYADAYQAADVTIQWIPGDFDAKISSGLLSSNGPDVFEYHFNYQLAKANQVVPLDDILGDARADFSEIDLTANSYDGKVYGIRMIDDPQLFYYRKSMLADAGIAPPVTIDDLIAATRALTTKDVKGLFLGNDNGIGWAATQILPATGQQYLTADNKVAFDTPETADAMLKVRELVDTGGLLSGAPADWWDPSAFNQGLCAMTKNGLWAMPAIQQALGDDFGVFPTPAFGAAGRQAVYLGGWSSFVSAKAKDVDAAKAFVKWLWIDNVEYQEDWCLNYGFHIPPRKSLAARATKLQSGPAAETVSLTEQFGWVDNPAWTTAMGAAFETFATDVILKKADAGRELAATVDRVETELKTLFG
ncbi:extracellular solute-binding protein [Solwaraspora sp. WMMD1047]|uniref:ABC transporter substrate-binding protein n=1 Tax=Solwaraspora sp. WMMD1047 TaxID=3016102 RepID=UPI00241617B5|nr:extracellular solute-binding protein [Solwaraspora sp. WMMD1047]MDG4831323.1 extracellular solute-binding protein [Solwaraspora sp. WMMD1047]